jgi:type IV pilus assembly protein PilM
MSIFSRKIVGIDFHDYSAELVELREKGGEIYLESFNRGLIPQDVVVNGEIKKEKTLQSILTELIKGANPKPVETQNAAIIFPASKVMTHIFTFPVKLSENEIRKAVPYAAETVIPFSINDVYWDFKILEKEEKSDENASQFVFFACIEKIVAEKYAKVLETINLKPFLFGIHAEALKYAMTGYTKEKKTSMLIDVGVLSVNFLITKNNVIKYFFGSNEGGQKLIKKLSENLGIQENKIFESKEKNSWGELEKDPGIKEFIEKNYKQANEIIKAEISKKTIQNVDEIILTGEFLNLPGFYEMVTKYFSDKKITIGDPKLGLKVDNKRFNPVGNGGELSIPYSIYFTDVIGISIKEIIENHNCGINLLPDRLKESVASKKKNYFIGLVAIFMAIVTLALSTFFFFTFQKLNYERTVMEIEKSAIEKTIFGTRYQEIRDGINEFNQEVEELSTIDSKFFSLPKVITDIEELVTDGIKITSMTYSDIDLSFEITGVAKAREDLLELQQNFENAEFIEKVVAPISNYDDKSQLSFSVKIFLNFAKLTPYASNTDTN